MRCQKLDIEKRVTPVFHTRNKIGQSNLRGVSDPGKLAFSEEGPANRQPVQTSDQDMVLIVDLYGVSVTFGMHCHEE